MEDLVTWLRAQLDEDERVARRAADFRFNYQGGSGVGDTLIRRFADPKRALAEVDAKRRILEQHPEDGEGFCGDGIGLVGCKWAHPCPTLRLVALPYADRPDYREEWGPVRSSRA
jgi:hypothetical protein